MRKTGRTRLRRRRRSIGGDVGIPIRTALIITDRTPKYPLVFCHGLLGFDYIGPASLPP
jgi:hypothetical protein